MHPQPCAPLLYGSVCSGIEAVSLAWQPLGLEAAWFAEIEPFPSAVLAHRYPHVPNLGDMTAITRQVRAGTCRRPTSWSAARRASRSALPARARD